MIQAYIFDQDGTLYPKKSKLTNALRERTKQWISESLDITRGEVDSIYARLPKEFPHPYHGFLSLGLSPEEYFQIFCEDTQEDESLEYSIDNYLFLLLRDALKDNPELLVVE